MAPRTIGQRQAVSGVTEMRGGGLPPEVDQRPGAVDVERLGLGSAKILRRNLNNHRSINGTGRLTTIH